jgi:hypothetical protein
MTRLSEIHTSLMNHEYRDLCGHCQGTPARLDKDPDSWEWLPFHCGVQLSLAHFRAIEIFVQARSTAITHPLDRPGSQVSFMPSSPIQQVLSSPIGASLTLAPKSCLALVPLHMPQPQPPSNHFDVNDLRSDGDLVFEFSLLFI